METDYAPWRACAAAILHQTIEDLKPPRFRKKKTEHKWRHTHMKQYTEDVEGVETFVGSPFCAMLCEFTEIDHRLFAREVQSRLQGARKFLDSYRGLYGVR